MLLEEVEEPGLSSSSLPRVSKASWFADSGTTLVATKRRTMRRIPRVRKGWKTRPSAAAGLQQSGARALRGRTASQSLAPAMRTAVPAEAGSIVAPPASASRSLSRKDAHDAPLGQRLRCLPLALLWVLRWCPRVRLHLLGR